MLIELPGGEISVSIEDDAYANNSIGAMTRQHYRIRIHVPNISADLDPEEWERVVRAVEWLRGQL